MAECRTAHPRTAMAEARRAASATAFYLSRSITRRTSLASHTPRPVAVGMPRAFSAFAMPYHDVILVAQSAATIGASSAALASACFLWASTAAARAFAVWSPSGFAPRAMTTARSPGTASGTGGQHSTGVFVAHTRTLLQPRNVRSRRVQTSAVDTLGKVAPIDAQPCAGSGEIERLLEAHR